MSANDGCHDPRWGNATGEAFDSLYPVGVRHEQVVLQLGKGTTETETEAFGMDVSTVDFVDTREQQAGFDLPESGKQFIWTSASPNQVDDSFDCLISMDDNETSCVAPSWSAGDETTCHGWKGEPPHARPIAVSASRQSGATDFGTVCGNLDEPAPPVLLFALSDPSTQPSQNGHAFLPPASGHETNGRTATEPHGNATQYSVTDEKLEKIKNRLEENPLLNDDKKLRRDLAIVLASQEVRRGKQIITVSSVVARLQAHKYRELLPAVVRGTISERMKNLFGDGAVSGGRRRRAGSTSQGRQGTAIGRHRQGDSQTP
jgi:hypothetical protein